MGVGPSATLLAVWWAAASGSALPVLSSDRNERCALLSWATGQARCAITASPLDATSESSLDLRARARWMVLTARSPALPRSSTLSVRLGDDELDAQLAMWLAFLSRPPEPLELTALLPEGTRRVVGLSAQGVLVSLPDRAALSPGDAASRARGAYAPDVLSAAMALTGFLAAGTAWYLLNTELTRVDKEYPLSLDTLRKKLVSLEALRFDDNVLYLNTPGHPFAGAGYYLAARTHQLDWPAAFASALVASAAWELVAEYQEVLSINDLINTPLGGLAIGEPIYQLGRFFRKSADTTLHRVLADLFALPSSLSPLWPRPDGTVRWLDERGYTADTAHELSGTIGILGSQVTGAPRALFGSIGLETLLLRRTDLAQPGAALELFLGPTLTTLGAGASFGARGLATLSLRSEATFAGLLYRRQRATPGGPEGLVGLVGLSALFEHDERLFVRPLEQRGLVGAPGLVATLRARWRGVSLDLDGHLHPVFAAIRSRAFDLHAVEQSTLLLPPPLPAHGYYFALGVRRAVTARLSYRGAELGGSGQWLSVDAAENVLPGRESVARLWDARSAGAIWYEQPLPLARTSLRLSLLWSTREGALEGRAVEPERETRASAELLHTL